MEQVFGLQPQGAGVPAGMAAEPFCLGHPPLQRQGDTALCIIHKPQHRGRTRLHTQKGLQVLTGGKAKTGGADDFGKIREYEMARL